MKQLTEKQIRFCEEYLIDLNATAAAIRAGYSEDTARQIASQNLAKLNIQECICQRRKELSDKLEITQERVLTEYARIGFFDIRKIYDDGGAIKDIKNLDEDTAAAIAGVEVCEETVTGPCETGKTVYGHTKKVKIHNKVSALADLGKHLGLFEQDNRQKVATEEIDLSKLTTEEKFQYLQLRQKAKANADSNNK